jgi:hypothetical protein
LLGRVIGRGMARHNEREARWTVDLLAIEPDARVLEIGFGPGVGDSICRRADNAWSRVGNRLL